MGLSQASTERLVNPNVVSKISVWWQLDLVDVFEDISPIMQKVRNVFKNLNLEIS